MSTDLLLPCPPKFPTPEACPKRSPTFDLPFLRSCGAAFQTLSVYGALGIVSYGWVLSRLLHFDCLRYAPLWFFSALFIYNLDRLKADPADAMNIPLRSRNAATLRAASRTLAIVSAVALLSIPLFERDWLMLLLTAGGAIFCANYSLPLFGFRFKEVPFLKTFFAPTLVTAAFVAPPLLRHACGATAICCAIAVAWTWVVTMFNMILCDLRDIDGDKITGIKSLPVGIGCKRTIFLLRALLLAGVILSVLLRLNSEPVDAFRWIGIAIFMSLYMAGLLYRVRRSAPESFYEWWVEGILFVPAFAYAILSHWH